MKTSSLTAMEDYLKYFWNVFKANHWEFTNSKQMTTDILFYFCQSAVQHPTIVSLPSARPVPALIPLSSTRPNLKGWG